MAVGIAIIGRDNTAAFGGGELQGNITKSLTFNGEPHDVTDDAALGWQLMTAVQGVKSIEFGMGGIFQDLELVSLFFGSSQAVEVVITFNDGVSTPTTITVDGVMSGLTVDMESDTPSTWSATFKSSGVPVFVAAT